MKVKLDKALVACANASGEYLRIVGTDGSQQIWNKINLEHDNPISEYF